eukprot:2538299-Rhodomonas_salina.6
MSAMVIPTCVNMSCDVWWQNAGCQIQRSHGESVGGLAGRWRGLRVLLASSSSSPCSTLAQPHGISGPCIAELLTRGTQNGISIPRIAYREAPHAIGPEPYLDA